MDLIKKSDCAIHPCIVFNLQFTLPALQEEVVVVYVPEWFMEEWIFCLKANLY
jgi:hypothetical protein